MWTWLQGDADAAFGTSTTNTSLCHRLSSRNPAPPPQERGRSVPGTTNAASTRQTAVCPMDEPEWADEGLCTLKRAARRHAPTPRIETMFCPPKPYSNARHSQVTCPAAHLPRGPAARRPFGRPKHRASKARNLWKAARAITCSTTPCVASRRRPARTSLCAETAAYGRTARIAPSPNAVPEK